MNGYLTRLVQRASGRGLTASASPAAHTQQPVGDARDPFESTAPLPPATPAPSNAVPRNLTESPVRSKWPDMRQVPPQHMEPRPRFHFEPPSLSLEPRSIPAPQATASPGAVHDSPVTPALRVVEHTIVERETVRQVSQAEKLVPPEPVEAPRAEPLAPIEAKSPGKPERLTPVPPPILNSPAPLKPQAPVRIEPVRKERPASPPPITRPREEPRLVIGQMKVEIIPAAPPPPPRASSRQRPRSQSAGSAVSSRFQFGLGQM